MSCSITLKPDIALGVVPTHLRFVGGLLPDAEGRLPRNADGEIIIVAGVMADGLADVAHRLNNLATRGII